MGWGESENAMSEIKGDVKYEGFREWAILELMGHRRLAGLITEAQIGGGSFVRIDVPKRIDGVDKPGEEMVATQFYSPGSIYCITPVSESIARRMAMNLQPEPATRWDLDRPALSAHAIDDQGDDEP